MRILPPPQRDAMFEIYSFCRAVDDVADDPGPRPPRVAELAQWRADVDALYAGDAPPRLRGLMEPVRTFGLERNDFIAVIDGMEMDTVGDIRAPELRDARPLLRSRRQRRRAAERESVRDAAG